MSDRFVEPSSVIAWRIVEPTLPGIAGTFVDEVPFIGKSAIIDPKTFGFDQVGYQTFHLHLVGSYQGKLRGMASTELEWL